MPADRITFSVQADVTASAAEWLDLARRVEASGFDTLYVADHVGVAASPFAALAAAAAVTTTLRLGTYVLNTGTYDPSALGRARPQRSTGCRTAALSSVSARVIRRANGPCRDAPIRRPRRGSGAWRR